MTAARHDAAVAGPTGDRRTLALAQVRPIGAADVPRAAAFLRAQLKPELPQEIWERSFRLSSAGDHPNAGFMLVDGDEVVGAYSATYAERRFDGRVERICGLGHWAVLPAYRRFSLSLLRAILSQPGYSFTDFLPTPSVATLNERLGFRTLETSMSIVPNLPLPPRRRGVRISSDPDEVERLLEGVDLEHYRDHAAAPETRHVALARGDERCYVIFRREQRRGALAVAYILHISNPTLFAQLAGPFAWHLITRHRTVVQMIETHLLPRPRLALTKATPKQRMYRGDTLRPEDVDFLYSVMISMPLI